MSNPPFPYTIFTVETSKIGEAYIEDYTPEHQAGLGAPAHYICPLSNSLLCGNMPMCQITNCKINIKDFMT